MPPVPKTRRLPFKPPRQLSAVAEPSASLTKSAFSGNTSRKRGRVATESSRNQKRNLNARLSPSPSPEQSLDRPEPAPSSSAVIPGSSPAPGSHEDEEQLQSSSPEPDYILAEVTREPDADNIMTSTPKIPSKLVTALLHHHFQDDGKTRITKDAAKLYAKYLDIFVRETVARAVYERRETSDADALVANSRPVLDSYLEVEELEKLVPQLLMDF